MREIALRPLDRNAGQTRIALLDAAKAGDIAAQATLDAQELSRLEVNGRTSTGEIIVRLNLFSGQITNPQLNMGGVLNYGDRKFVAAVYNTSNRVRALIIEYDADGKQGLTHECVIPGNYKLEGPGFQVQRRGRDLYWTATAHANTANADGSRENVLAVGVFEDLLPALVLPQVSPFSDVPTDHWAYPYVIACLDHGAISGYADGSFRGGGMINRFQEAKIMAVGNGWVPE